MTGHDPVIRTTGLTKDFGGVRANDQIDLAVERGTLHAVIGPNGAGKTTLFHVLAGFHRPTAGDVYIKGEQVTGWAPHRIAALGVGRSFQITNVFPGLAVLENVRLAVQRQRPYAWGLWRPATSYQEDLDRALQVLEQVGLAGRRRDPAHALPHGDQRKLELAIILAGDPDVLLLDEPTSGLSVEEVPSFIEIIEELRQAREQTIMLVEHKIDVVMALSERVTVLDHGAVLADGGPEEIASDEAVQRAYLGGSDEKFAFDVE